MIIPQNESFLLSGLQNIEYQVQNTVISQLHKYRQLSVFDSFIENPSMNHDDINPIIKSKYLNLRNKIHFENKEDELEFEDIIIKWNQSHQQNVRLNQMVTEYANQQIQNNQYQTDFPVSKIHILDYEENQPISSFSLLTSKDQIIDHQILQDLPQEKSTQTDYPSEMVDKCSQSDFRDIDEKDTENVVEFLILPSSKSQRTNNS